MYPSQQPTSISSVMDPTQLSIMAGFINDTLRPLQNSIARDICSKIVTSTWASDQLATFAIESFIAQCDFDPTVSKDVNKTKLAALKSLVATMATFNCWDPNDIHQSYLDNHQAIAQEAHQLIHTMVNKLTRYAQQQQQQPGQPWQQPHQGAQPWQRPQQQQPAQPWQRPQQQPQASQPWQQPQQMSNSNITNVNTQSDQPKFNPMTGRPDVPSPPTETNNLVNAMSNQTPKRNASVQVISKNKPIQTQLDSKKDDIPTIDSDEPSTPRRVSSAIMENISKSVPVAEETDPVDQIQEMYEVVEKETFAKDIYHLDLYKKYNILPPLNGYDFWQINDGGVQLMRYSDKHHALGDARQSVHALGNQLFKADVLDNQTNWQVSGDNPYLTYKEVIHQSDTVTHPYTVMCQVRHRHPEDSTILTRATLGTTFVQSVSLEALSARYPELIEDEDDGVALRDAMCAQAQELIKQLKGSCNALSNMAKFFESVSKLDLYPITRNIVLDYYKRVIAIVNEAVTSCARPDLTITEYNTDVYKLLLSQLTMPYNAYDNDSLNDPVVSNLTSDQIDEFKDYVASKLRAITADLSLNDDLITVTINRQLAVLMLDVEFQSLDLGIPSNGNWVMVTPNQSDTISTLCATLAKINREKVTDDGSTYRPESIYVTTNDGYVLEASHQYMLPMASVFVMRCIQSQPI